MNIQEIKLGMSRGRLTIWFQRGRRGVRQLVRNVAGRVRGTPDIRKLQRAGLDLGRQVFIGSGAFLDPDFCFLIKIGDEAVVSVNVTILAHDASTRHSVGWTRVAPVAIGAGAFVGAGTIILPGVTVGEGAVVGAGSVVRHDVAPRTIVAGNPARLVGQVDDYVARHAARLSHTPQWPRAGWTAATGVTAERVATMRAALAEHGEAFIK